MLHFNAKMNHPTALVDLPRLHRYSANVSLQSRVSSLAAVMDTKDTLIWPCYFKWADPKEGLFKSTVLVKYSYDWFPRDNDHTPEKWAGQAQLSGISQCCFSKWVKTQTLPFSHAKNDYRLNVAPVGERMNVSFHQFRCRARLHSSWDEDMMQLCNHSRPFMRSYQFNGILINPKCP